MTGSTPHAGETQPSTDRSDRPSVGRRTRGGMDGAWWHDEPAPPAAGGSPMVDPDPGVRPEPAVAEPVEASAMLGPGPISLDDTADIPVVVEEPAQPATSDLLADAPDDPDEIGGDDEVILLPEPRPRLVDIRSPVPAARPSPSPVPPPAPPSVPPPVQTAAQTAAAARASLAARDRPVDPPAAPSSAPAPASASADPESFWLPTEEVPRRNAAWPVPQMRGGRPGSVHRSTLSQTRPTRRRPRCTGSGLIALVLLSLCAAFFGWVSAEPFWLAVGHGDRGTATVTRCTGGGISQRCVGEFTAADGHTARVTLLGLADGKGLTGESVSARMVDRDSRQAYVGDDPIALHLRWAVGLLLVLLCGAGIAWASGAARLEDRRARRRAVLGSVAGPILLTLGFLAATF